MSVQLHNKRNLVLCDITIEPMLTPRQETLYILCPVSGWLCFLSTDNQIWYWSFGGGVERKGEPNNIFISISTANYTYYIYTQWYQDTVHISVFLNLGYVPIKIVFVNDSNLGFTSFPFFFLYSFYYFKFICYN